MSRTATPLSQIRSLGQLKNLLVETFDTLTKVVLTKNKQISDDKIVSPQTTVSRNSSSDIKNGSNISQSLSEFVKEQENELEKALLDWADSGNNSNRKSPPGSPEKKLDIKSVTSQLTAKGQLSKATVENHSRFLIKSLAVSKSPVSQLLRLEELCRHLLNYPEAKGILVKDHAIRLALRLKQYSKDESVKAQAREVLALLGYTDPPASSGIRILSIDGGGIRGIMALEMLRQLERNTGKRIYELFDLICGVSTGAILSVLFTGLEMSIDDCEVLYKKMSCDIFKQNPWLGTGRLVWNHAYYDTKSWVSMLRNTYGEGGLTEINKRITPKLAVFSAIVNLPTLQAYMFRSYALPYRSQSNYMGSCNYKVWEAIRASAAAPGYFEDFCSNGLIHQDGGLLWNNPTGLAIHEAKLLWPKEEISCVVSLGTGRYIPLPDNSGTTTTNLKTKILKILDSATDTEGVHSLLHDLLPPDVYFRFNPYLTEVITMDEIRPEKIQQLKLDAQMYIRKNEHKISQAAKKLVKPRATFQKTIDWVTLQKELKL